MAQVKNKVVKLPVKKIAATPSKPAKAEDTPAKTARKAPLKKKTVPAAKKESAKKPKTTSTAVAVEARQAENSLPATPKKGRGRPPGLNHQPCPYCSNPCVKKGTRDYKNAGGAAMRYHCIASTKGCRRYHLRSPETLEVIDIPETLRRKAPTTLGKKRLTPKTVSDFIGVADDVLTALRDSTGNESVADAFSAALDEIRDKLAPHLQPSIIQVRDAIDDAARHFGVTNTSKAKWLKANEAAAIQEAGVDGLDDKDNTHLKAAVEKLATIFAVIEAAQNKAAGASEEAEAS